jgi:Spy/CpxP family protein refolding chaperone
MEGNETTRKAAGLVALIFLLGIAIGALGTHFWGERVWSARAERPGRTKIVEDLTREVGLTPDQKKQVETIVDDTRTKFDAIHEQERPQYEQARQEGRNRIRALLTPEQLPKFEDFLRRLDEERKKKEQRR